MQQEFASETLLKPATLYFALDGEDAAAADHRETARRGVSRAALHLAYVNPDVVVTPKQDSGRKTVWSKMLNFVAEGFATCGGSLHHPVPYFMSDDHWKEEKGSRPEILSPNGQRVTATFPVTSPSVSPRWNWSASSREVAAAIGAHLRKERHIKRAVDALSELDDQTLQDIGIPHRSRIEYVVRYCHDC
ncbi:uncharacterized protein YjiS (DUF1127 family) [Nitrobacteraceae bacterium AZCC 1564]